MSGEDSSKDINVADEDMLAAIKLVKDLKTSVSDVISHVQAQILKVKQGEWNTAKGVSFLEVKYQMLLSYLINLTQLLCIRVRGQPIRDNPVVERLVEIRTVLEKMRPIDQKLKYQIDKLLKTATTGTIGQNDPLRFKPNLANLQSKFSDDSSEESEGAGETKPTGSKVYRPPKLSAVYYDGDDTLKQRQEKHVERAKKRALSSSVMRELRSEYDEGPEEIQETADLHRQREDKAGKERTEYEEKYFLRMAVTRKEKNASKKLRTEMNNLTHFGDFSALTDETSMPDGMPTKKRKRSSQGKKKGKASKKWKRKK